MKRRAKWSLAGLNDLERATESPHFLSYLFLSCAAASASALIQCPALSYRPASSFIQFPKERRPEVSTAVV